MCPLAVSLMLWNRLLYILKDLFKIIIIIVNSCWNFHCCVQCLIKFPNCAAEQNQSALSHYHFQICCRYLDDTAASFCLRISHKSFPLARPSCHIILTHLLDLVSLPASELGLFTPLLSVKLPCWDAKRWPPAPVAVIQDHLHLSLSLFAVSHLTPWEVTAA